MYLNILKKDLKRKKTMNCIILLFVVLSTMFFASSVNNILSVVGGLDRYLDMAGMMDHVAMVLEPEDGEPLADLLRDNDKVDAFKRETVLMFTPDKLSCNGNAMDEPGQLVLSSVGTMQVNCYDLNNETITAVEHGKVLLTSFEMDKLGAAPGDTITVKVGGETLTLEVAGICKDAVLGSSMVGCPRCILNDDDFAQFYAIDSIRQSYRCGMYLIDTDNETAADLFSTVAGCQFHVPRATIRLSYMPEMLTAGIIMVVSIFLILISFVVLRFTIGFTIQEEFREIGVMKAIGLRSSSIRSLYLAKYFGIAVIGALIGFAASFPFGGLLMDSVSRSMVLGNAHPVLSGIVCTVIIIGIVVLFCYSCTASIRKLTPIDAVRSGQTGERFRKHGSLSLGKTPLGASGFLSLNNVISAPKQSAILIVVFTLCAMLVMMLSNMAETFTSPKMISICSLTESDLYLETEIYESEILKGGMTIAEANREIEQILADDHMPAVVTTKGSYNTAVSFGEKSTSVRFMHCADTEVADYVYSDGTAPQYPNEIAVTNVVANELGVSIGDTIHLAMGGEEGDYIITALFDTMNNLGMTGYFYEGAEPPHAAMQWVDDHQITFTDHPDAETIEMRREKVQELFDTKKVYTIGEYVETCTGVGDTLLSVRNLTLAVSLIIIILMTVLLERSFISKERTEIALLKAVGFRNRSVVGVHVLRFVLIAGASVAVSALVSAPATRLIMAPLYQMLGSVKTIVVSINTMDNYLILPVTVLAIVIVTAALTALYTGSIKASDTADIE
ncbi:MAG: ABC transporter permease [Oscillospiraceae bacterium]|nr:ABC transporter permease [Oscillospiraceae bacterium]